MAQVISDAEITAILTDMADSQVSALSPIKSPKRPVNEIPDAEPAPKKRKADEGSKSIRNRLTTLETRRAKYKRSLQVLREHSKNSTCSYGFQYRQKPHIRFDQEFQSPSPYGGACPYDQTAGKELSCRQPGHQSPAAATTDSVPKTAQFPGSQKPGCQQSQTKA